MTIDELSSAVKRTIEGSFEFVRVRGEVSQLRVPSSGHIYFALKDEKKYSFGNLGRALLPGFLSIQRKGWMLYALAK